MVARHHQFAVDFVADYDDSMSSGDFTDLSEFFFGPDSSGRVVGVAEEEDFRGRVGAFLFEIFEVDAICETASFRDFFKRVVEYGAAVVAD